MKSRNCSDDSDSLTISYKKKVLGRDLLIKRDLRDINQHVGFFLVLNIKGKLPMILKVTVNFIV